MPPEEEQRDLVAELEERVRDAVCKFTGLAGGVERHIEVVVEHVRELVAKRDKEE